MNTNSQELSSSRLLSSWATFGTRMISRLESGVLTSDLHEGNLLIRGGMDDVVIIDYGGITRIDYPNSRELIIVTLMSLLEWLDIHRAAAFRFGFLTQGGPVARVIFDEIRRRYDFHAFIEDDTLKYKITGEALKEVSVSILLSEYRKWQVRRGSLKIGNKVDRNPNLADLAQWRAWRDREKLPISDLDEFYYRRHLIAGCYHGSAKHFLEALLNLQGYYQVNGQVSAVVAIGNFVLRLKETSPCQIAPQFTLEIKRLCRQLEADLSPFALAQIESLSRYSNVFHLLWALDDLANGYLHG